MVLDRKYNRESGCFLPKGIEQPLFDEGQWVLAFLDILMSYDLYLDDSVITSFQPLSETPILC